MDGEVRAGQRGEELRGTEGLWTCRSLESPSRPGPPLSMLRIKSENGEQAFLLMMQPEDTVGDVRKLLAQARWVQGRAGGCRRPWPHGLA